MRGRVVAFLVVALMLTLPQVEAVTFGSVRTALDSSGSTTRVVTAPTGIAAGHLLLAHVVHNDGTAASITPPAGWTLKAQFNNSGNVGVGIYYKIATASEPASYTWTFGRSTKSAVSISRYYDIDTTSPFDGNGAVVIVNGTTLTLPSISTTGPNPRVVGFAASASATSFTPASGMTERYDTASTVTLEAADVVQATAGASGAKTYTAASSAKLAGYLVALRSGAVPSVSLDKAASSAWEANGTARFWANLSVPSQLAVSVSYAIGGTASGAGVDHTLASGTLTFAAGQTSKGINASVVNDATAEPNETVIITLSGPANATLGAIPVATHTIVNDDTTIGFTAASSTPSEAAGAHAIAVSLGTPSPKTVSVSYAASPGTATSGSDYALASGTLTVAPWATTASIPLSILQDVVDEPDETLSVSLSAPMDALLGTASHAITIVDDDATPTIGFTSAASSVGEASSPSLAVVLSAASGRTVRVSYATSADTATIPGDVGAASGTLVLLPGETTKAIALSPVQDALDEADETFSVALSAAENATLSVATHTLTIVDDDAPPLVRFTTASSSGSEGGTLAATSVQLSGASALPVSVLVGVTGGTATPESDFTGGGATVTFAPGVTTGSVAIAAVNDALAEGDETIVLSLSGAANATIGSPSSHTLTLLDDESAVSVRVAQTEASANEAAGSGSALVILSGAAAMPVSVDYAWTPGSAAAGLDYVASGGTLVFASGTTSLTVPFALVDDEIVEPDESFALVLSNATNASLGAATHVFTILNDDTPYPVAGFAASGVSLAEGAASPAIVVALSAPHPRLVSVPYTVAGTATPGGDFSLAAGTLAFLPGETTKEIAYTVVDDAVAEPDETIVVTLGTPTRATLGAAVFTRTIANDDVVPPVASFAAASSSVSETAPSAAIRVQLDRAATSPVSVAYAVTGGSATGDAIDYSLPVGTLSFDVGESAKDIVVVLSDDPAAEAVETVVIGLSSPVGATLGSATHTLSITSDDVPAVTIAFAAASSAVGESGGTTQIVVRASAAIPESFEVSYQVAGGTATAGSDFALAAGSLFFDVGETTKSIAVEISGDPDYEPDESIVIALTNPTVGTLGSPAIHVLTILNDDPQPPTFSFASSSGSATEASGTALIAVTLSPASSAATSVAYAVTGGTATAGVDYTLASGTLSFDPGDTAKSILLTLLDDSAAEAGETIVIALSSPLGGVLGSSEHVFTIVNDDAVAPSVQWNLTASTASEGAGTATIRAYLSSSAATSVSVAYSVTGGTATGSGTDFTLAAGTLTFAAGETSRPLTVAIVDDSLVEGDETIVVTLASPVNAVLGATTSHTLTILENDAAATSRVDVASTPVLADGSPHTGATWGGWSAEPGAQGVTSTNYLKLVNTGTLASPRVVISFGASGFVGRTDSSFVIPTSSNLQFAWWEDTTPASSAPSEGTFAFGAATASPSVTLQFTGTSRVIYVAYRIVSMPDVLLDQPYDGSFTVTEI